jgi:CDGSH-type Zn-finger protein
MQIVDTVGNVVPHTQVLASCRRGRSGLAPFCEGAHERSTAWAGTRTDTEHDAPKAGEK